MLSDKKIIIMEIILSKHCESLTGSLGYGFGYSIVKRGKRFFSQRSNHNVSVPPDGHWRFICACAELAKNKLQIADISVKRDELREALYDAHHFNAARCLALQNYNARDIINLKITFGL